MSNAMVIMTRNLVESLDDSEAVASLVADNGRSKKKKSARDIQEWVLDYGDAVTVRSWQEKLAGAVGAVPKLPPKKKKIEGSNGSKGRTVEVPVVVPSSWWAPIPDWLEALEARAEQLEKDGS